MSVYSGRIDTYSVNVLSPKQYNGRRLMNLQGSFGSAILWFHPDGATLPDNRKRTSQNIFDVYYHTSEWAPMLDVLRNETPVYFVFSDTSNSAQVHTGHEPVGEEEAGGA